MKKLEILREIIEIAEGKGFSFNQSVEIGNLVDGTNYYSVVFRHDFAKALWGEEQSYKDLISKYKELEEQGKSVDYDLIPPPRWKRNLEALVTAEDKFDFLEKTIKYIKDGGEISKEEFSSRKDDLMSELASRFKES